MRGTFWHPAAQGRAAEWWARCDNCHWSGPMPRFSYWTVGDLSLYLCDHAWCKGNQELLQAMKAIGWERHW